MFQFRWLFIWGFLFLCSCSSFGPSYEERAQLHLRIGTAHLNNGNFPAALSELLQAEKYDDENPVIQNNLGLAYFVRQKYTLAEKHMRKAIELEPKYTEARNNLGRTLIELGLYKEAIKELQIAVDDLTYQSPEKSYSNLGLAQFKAGQYQQALKTLKKALDLKSDTCTTHNYYARALFESNYIAAASRAFDQAIQACKEQKFDEPHFYSALSFYKLGQREEAEARFKEVIENFPEGKYASQAREMLKLFQ